MVEREPQRVCYIESTPEWFSYSVLRFFYRDADWLFVPLQDLSVEEREQEFHKATYFFISGFGHSEVAVAASAAGCKLIGPRADVPAEIPVLESRPWDPLAVYGLIRFYDKPATVRSFLTMWFRLNWYWKLGRQALASESLPSIITKLKKFIFWS